MTDEPESRPGLAPKRNHLRYPRAPALVLFMMKNQKLLLRLTTLATALAGCLFLLSAGDGGETEGTLLGSSTGQQIGGIRQLAVEDSDATSTVGAGVGATTVKNDDDYNGKHFDATNKLVLSTMPRTMTGEHKDRIEHIRFHLHCVADAIKQAKTSVHLVIFTGDDEVANYVKNTKSLSHMEVAKVPFLKEREFSWNLKRLAQLHPNARGYGYMNGDICPTPSFLDASNEFLVADCPEGGIVKSKWRFVSGLRYNAELQLEELDLDNALSVATSAHREKYAAGGVDFFAWNHDMFVKHIVPEIPRFSMPLWAADNFLFEDGACNALTFLPEKGWQNGEDETLLIHLEHNARNGMPGPINTMWKASSEKVVNNWDERDKVDRTHWSTRRCGFRPDNTATDCYYNFPTGAFSCSRNVGLCEVSE